MIPTIGLLQNGHVSLEEEKIYLLIDAPLWYIVSINRTSNM